MEHVHNNGHLCNEPHTLEEIGKELGLTRERIRQIEKIALRKLSRNPLAKHLFEQFVSKRP
jgi:RNA polymerase primary sigma factor